MDDGLKQRIVGALVLLALLVIFYPCCLIATGWSRWTPPVKFLLPSAFPPRPFKRPTSLWWRSQTWHHRQRRCWCLLSIWLKTGADCCPNGEA